MFGAFPIIPACRRISIFKLHIYFPILVSTFYFGKKPLLVTQLWGFRYFGHSSFQNVTLITQVWNRMSLWSLPSINTVKQWHVISTWPNQGQNSIFVSLSPRSPFYSICFASHPFPSSLHHPIRERDGVVRRQGFTGVVVMMVRPVMAGRTEQIGGDIEGLGSYGFEGGWRSIPLQISFLSFFSISSSCSGRGARVQVNCCCFLFFLLAGYGGLVSWVWAAALVVNWD